MDLNLIKKLIKIVEQSEITDLSVEEGELKVSITKSSNNQKYAVMGPPPMPAVSYQAPAPSAAPAPAPAQAQENNYHEIKSPIVGTFYKASSPESEPFVKVGDHIKPGMVLCIVEAMKLMNEIESDVSGKIVKILVDNASPVEYNQPLFLIEEE